MGCPDADADADGHGHGRQLQQQLQNTTNMNRNTITYLDVSLNKFGNNGAKLIQQLVQTNRNITTLNLIDCSVGRHHMKLISDQLRCNNCPFLQKLGFSLDVSLAILDSVAIMGNVL